MKYRVRTWQQALAISVLITALATCVPIAVVELVLSPFSNDVKIPGFMIAATVPLFIAGPISVFAMYMVKTLHETLDTLDMLVKFDALTGLSSRSHFLQQAESIRACGGFLVLLDADHFKRINDTFGHEAGDRALKYLATSMMEVFAGHGRVGRLGGEEFGICIPKSSRKQVDLLLTAFSTKLRNEGISYSSQHIRITVSGGVVGLDKERSMPELLRLADMNLYEAKAKGRDCFVFEKRLDQKVMHAA